MQIELRPQGQELFKKTLYVSQRPQNGEAVYSVVPPFRVVALLTPGNGVISKPSQCWTCSTMWRPSETAKYKQFAKKWLEEGKVFCVGRIDSKGLIEFSKEGIEHLKEMDRLYEWA